MSGKIKAVVLAAGKSKRMNSEKSKVVHRILGKEIINYTLDALAGAGIRDEDMIVVLGENRREVEAAVTRKVSYTIQKEQLGTADALMSASDILDGFDGDMVVTVGDNPYITASEFQKMMGHHAETGTVCTLLSAVFPGDPPPYGRILRNSAGKAESIIEAADADEDQLKIREVNAGIYVFRNPAVFPLLREIGSDNEKKEFYLTDIIEVLHKKGYSPEVVVTKNYFTAIGINNRRELSEAQEKFNRDNIIEIESRGVTILQPETVTIEPGVKIGKDTIIFPSTYLASGTRIGCDCTIGPFVYLKNVEISDGEEVSHTKRTG